MNQRKLNVQQTEIGPGILARLNKWKPKKKKKKKGASQVKSILLKICRLL